MISEIMVASDDGRLPQWIEIANDSAAAVSLSGWSLEIENDSADADVVGAGDRLSLISAMWKSVQIKSHSLSRKKPDVTPVSAMATVIYAQIASSTSRAM